jgi:hypothetical protein
MYDDERPIRGIGLGRGGPRTTERVDVASLFEASTELEATLNEVGRVIAQVKPDLVTVLLPEYYTASYAEIAPHVALETLVRLAAVRAGVGVEMLTRPTVRSRLNLPVKGKLSTHVAARIPDPVGRYWSAGRDVAALAALAADTESSTRGSCPCGRHSGTRSAWIADRISRAKKPASAIVSACADSHPRCSRLPRAIVAPRLSGGDASMRRIDAVIASASGTSRGRQR